MNKQVEQIKSEIERRIENIKRYVLNPGSDKRFAVVPEQLSRILSFIGSLESEPGNDDLDKTSKDILKDFGAIGTTDKGLRFYSEDSMLGICKAGANWQKWQIMKDAKDATVIMTHVTNESLSPALSVVILPDTFQEGDKVKVIIVPKTNSPKRGG